MKVIATKRGYDGIAIREEGEEFDMPDEATGTWFEPVEAKAKRGRPAKEDKAEKSE
jgi:hypothetical protein